jgi:hypothetical protein
MIQFLTEEDVAAKIRRLDRPRRMAVAFWGSGSIKALGLDSGDPIQIVCNLTSGGTNPSVIRELIRRGHGVRSDPRLHGKIYLGKGKTIIGSSNASANGLALEGNELKNWIEANVLTDDAEIVRRSSAQFERSWARSEEITETMLRKAESDFRTRRRVAPIIGQTDPDLLTALSEAPQMFRNRNIYLVIYRAHDRDDLPDARRGFAEDDWAASLEDGSDYICFYYGPRGGLTFAGL